jgi:UDP-GlcNAc:undecaprenyl-phosphate GlcNAc-1-phosphate transferase
MGDSGSGFLGFTLATMSVLGSYKHISNVLLTVLVPALILSVPFFDSAMVTLIRLRHRRPLFQGGRDHPAHRLVAMGLPERKAVLLLYMLSILGGGVALASSFMGFLTGVSVSLIFVLTFVAIGLVLYEVHVYEGPLPEKPFTVLPKPFRYKKWIAVMLLDVVLVGVAYVSAFLLRYEGELPARVSADVAETLPVVLAAKLAAFWLFGIYRGAWRYVGMVDLVRLTEAVVAGSLFAVMALFMWMRLEALSRAALILDGILTLLLFSGSRLSLRVLREYLVAQNGNGRRALIFGAGRGGMLLLTELRQNPALPYRPVGFVDDDPQKKATLVRGLPVLGSRAEIPELIRRYKVEEVLVAAPSCPAEVLKEVVEVCASAGVPARQLGRLLE